MKRFARWMPVLLCIGPLVLFLPGLLRGGALYWGTPLLQFVPWREMAFALLRRGVVPLWNPYSGMGAPLLANYQSAVFYPPHWLHFLLPVAEVQTLIVITHLILAAFGMQRFMRRLGRSSFAQAVAALAFSLSGYMIARAGFLSITVTAAWLPWLMEGGERLCTASETGAAYRRNVLLLGCLLGMQWLAGHAQTAWYSIVLLAAWVLWRGGVSQSRKQRLCIFAGFGAAGVLGFLLAAVQLLPTLEYLLQSTRAAQVDEAFALTYSFWPWRITGLLAPDLFGNPARGGYWGYANYHEDAIYLGVLPFLLALHGIRCGWKKQCDDHELVRFFSLVTPAVLLLALGKNTPLFPFLFRHIPTFGMFQAPTRWNLLLVFSLSVLAGVGADAWKPPREKALYWTRLGTAGAAIIGVAALLGRTLVGDVTDSFIRAFAAAGIGLTAAGLLSLTRKREMNTAWLAAAAAVVLVDLLYAGSGLNPVVSSGVYQGKTHLSALVADGHRIYMDSDLEYDLKFNVLFRFESFDSELPPALFRETGIPNVAMLDDIPSANNFDPLLPERYVTWMEAMEEVPLETAAAMLQLMDVGWRAVEDDAAPSGVRYTPFPDASRVRLVPSAVPAASGEEALEYVLSGNFDPDNVVVLETNDGELPSGSGGTVELLPDGSPNSASIEVLSDDGGWLLLSDSVYPGWEALLDGEAAELLTADYLFRAVWVPAGEHAVTFQYRSTAFQVGAGLSLLSAAAALAMGVAWRRE